jgi:predicted DNA-binding protein
LYYNYQFLYYGSAMPISVRLPPRVEQQLAAYCAQTKLTKSEAVKRALERLFDQEGTPAAANPAAKRFIGSDRSPGDIAAHTKRLLREHFRGK